ncbi:hypothetical protein DAEQUDRAFT_726989 [Daedalea quercina L-15889]|uniref:DUF6699 domain-containing protein n=1 Tax=Daedalea quercina L-15889 TaxID=1314783 RepID=A0A165Q7M0_9APHY|nr:hypothetical protein DAEQUDRAFT_726989 [Daedalea quercina L-15889]
MTVADTYSSYAQGAESLEGAVWSPASSHAPQCGPFSPLPSTTSANLKSCAFSTQSPPRAYYGGSIVPLPSVSPRYQTSKLGESAGKVSPSMKHERLPSTEVAPLLARAPKGGRVPLKWDMAFGLDQSFDRALRVPTMSSVALHGPALPSVTSAVIVVISGPKYPYEVLIQRSSDPAAPSYVTVRDVLIAVHANLHQVITQGEMTEARKRDNVWRGAFAAYQRRTGGNDKKPMKRIDLLGGRTVFQGVVLAGRAGKLPKLELLVGHSGSP